MQVVVIKPKLGIWRHFALQNGIVMGRAAIGFTEEFDVLLFISQD
jgi:hypothetical protein